MVTVEKKKNKRTKLEGDKSFEFEFEFEEGMDWVQALLKFDEKFKSSEFSGHAKGLDDHLEKFSQIFSKLSPSHVDQVTGVLATYPPDRYYLTWSFILEARGHLEQLDLTVYAQQVHFFIVNSHKDQITEVPSRFNAVCKRYMEKMVHSNRAMTAIKTLQIALEKMAITHEHLTPIHSYFVQACLMARCYKQALPILERDIIEIEPIKMDVTPLDSLLYFYYGGIAYIGLKQFRRAQDFFVLAISSPAQTLSSIVVEAHRKFILVSLLLDGTVPQLPKYTAGVIIRLLKNINHEYLDFAKAYQTHKQQALQESYNKTLAVFQRDRNSGLADQVVKSLYRRNILRLTQTYLTLSLSDIANAVQLSSPKQAEEFILKMISDGEMKACINQKDSMVSFESGNSYEESEIQLDRNIVSTASLTQKVDTLQKKIAKSSSYLHKIASEKSNVFEEGDYDQSEKVVFGVIPMQ